MNWDEYFISLCFGIQKKSKDRSTQLGAIIVDQDNQIVSTGFNGFPRGVLDFKEEYHERPLKYKITEHAERNAIYAAARKGCSTKNCRLYMSFEPIPCTDCARGIIQSGITEIVGPNRPFEGKGKQWTDDLKIAEEMLKQASIVLRKVDFNVTPYVS